MTITSSDIELTSSDRHKFGAYLAEPNVPARGAIVVLQEFFGVNHHIRSVTDRFAKHGYLAIAPAIFDRVERAVSLDYSEAHMTKGRALRAKLSMDETMLDIQAATDAVSRAGKVAAIGYCWGGSLGFIASARQQGLACAVAYYGAQIAAHAHEKPKVPVMMHFAEHDEYIPPSDIDAIRKARPEVTIYSYPGAHHGFNCDERQFFEPKSAALALARTLEFVERYVG